MQSLFKNLPELLKNRQSSRNRALLKRPAPVESQHKEPANDSASSSQQPLPEANIPPPPKRQNTLPASASKPAKSDTATDSPMSIDDSRSYNSTPPAWVMRTPEFANKPFPIASEAFAAYQIDPRQSRTSSYQQIPRDTGIPFSQQMAASGLPDLMPIMFPSEDPLAYPMQPMSTLEADHFSRDQGTPSFGQYTFGSTPAALTSPVDTPGGGSMPLSSSGFENFNMPAFTNGTMGSGGMPIQQQQSNQQSPGSGSQQGHSHSQSRGSITNGDDTHESPDLVSIPDQNFVFQSYSFPPSIVPTGQSTQQIQAPTSTQGLNGMGVDDVSNPIMAGFDTNNITLDDIFGNAASRPAGSVAAEDWIQWMA